MDNYKTKWHKELDIFTKIKSLIVLEGNIYDLYPYPEDGAIIPLQEYLHTYFEEELGYQTIVFYNNLRGFYNDFEKKHVADFAKNVGKNEDGMSIRAAFSGNPSDDIAPILVNRALSQDQNSTVIIMDTASRYISDPQNMDQNEVDSFTSLLQTTLEAKEVITADGRTLKNILVLVTNKASDLPAWLYQQNPHGKTITLHTPTREEREALVKKQFSAFFDKEVYTKDMEYYRNRSEKLEKLQDRFVALTENFTFTELNDIRKLCKLEKTPVRKMCDVIDLYKYGIKDNPWKNIDHDKIRKAKEDYFDLRVKGQDTAIAKVMSILKRGVEGMSGAQGSSPTRPKGVLFFAGPSGVGKTETAKTLSQLLFGDESCCKIFDMSEYDSPNSDQRLFGAPPGYVGYENGGQLTEHIKNNPFSVLLFDEIEKADSSVFDKFLQIVDDGRMTDGQGNTVYFSESIIIFTSNLGIVTEDETGKTVPNVTMDMSYEEVTKNITAAVEKFFKYKLNRPELLNKMGKNIVVYDFIRPEWAQKILDDKLEKIKSDISEEKNIEVEYSQETREFLRSKVMANLDEGGRGVGNILEKYQINTLAEYIFDNDIREPETGLIVDKIIDCDPPKIMCTIKEQEL